MKVNTIMTKNKNEYYSVLCFGVGQARGPSAAARGPGAEAT